MAIRLYLSYLILSSVLEPYILLIYAVFCINPTSINVIFIPDILHQKGWLPVQLCFVFFNVSDAECFSGDDNFSSILQQQRKPWMSVLSKNPAQT